MAVKNLKEFTLSINTAIASFTLVEAVTFQRRIALQLLRQIVMATPVKTGRARGNWQVDINNIPSGYYTERKDPSGNATIAAGEAKLAVLPPYAVVWIANNLPYIIPLEDGWSKQSAPGMMVAAAVARAELVVV